jgi:hypothetical protein
LPSTPSTLSDTHTRARAHARRTDVGKLINAKVELLGNITELFKPNLTIPHIPAVTIPTIDLKAHLDEVTGEGGL